MTKTQFRSAEELSRTQWADKFTSVAEGCLYKPNGNSPFTLHEYFKLGLLGKNIRMLELNAGAALIDQMVADVVTEMNVSIEGDETGTEEAKKWLETIFYTEVLEQTARSYFSAGYAVQQTIRDLEAGSSENTYTSVNVAPETWYPKVPTFVYQSIKEGRKVSVFQDGFPDKHWYGFEEKHTTGKVEYALYELENPNDLEGTKIPLNSLSRFKGLKDGVATELELIPIFQVNRTRSSGKYFGESILTKVWGNLQEITEIKTQIRQERIKHFRAKFAAPIQSLQRAQRIDDSEALPQNSKQERIAAVEAQATFDMNQEVFPIPSGGQIPQYIQRDLEIITKGAELIAQCLSEIAFTVGCPRSIFNLDERGTIHVETEKKKDRRYVKHILQAQRKMEWITVQTLQTWRKWNGKKDEAKITVTLQSPFDFTVEEKVELFRQMNSDAKFVSQEEAIKQLWPDMSQEEQDEMIAAIGEEDKALVPALSTPFPVELPDDE